MTAAIVIGVGVLLGAGLVASQLFRLRDWLRNAPPVNPLEGKDDDDRDDDDDITGT